MSGRRLLNEKLPGLGVENVWGGLPLGLSLSWVRGTGPPRFEKVRWRLVVKNLGPGAGGAGWLPG